MTIARLIKLGGSVAVTIPAAILREAKFDKDSAVKINVEDGAVVIRHARKPRRLHDILAECDLAAPLSAELAEFDAAPSTGGEII